MPVLVLPDVPVRPELEVLDRDEEVVVEIVVEATEVEETLKEATNGSNESCRRRGN